MYFPPMCFNFLKHEVIAYCPLKATKIKVLKLEVAAIIPSKCPYIGAYGKLLIFIIFVRPNMEKVKYCDTNDYAAEYHRSSNPKFTGSSGKSASIPIKLVVGTDKSTSSNLMPSIHTSPVPINIMPKLMEALSSNTSKTIA